ncbi:DEAD/DEAH box helicase [Verrucomicrobia bacterium]|jgi:ATP-dependent helicase HrpB|nr:DEAD/DEAH box helicase [Verrucomicrobiota bacterium]
MESSSDLPIVSIQAELLDSLDRENRVIIVAPTGSGKTTQLPQYVLDAGTLENQKIVVLQPRRVAARAVARRVCEERNISLGTEVGYQVRFDDRTSRETRLVFMTEGVLLRQLQDQANLKDVGVLILDEFHERTLYSDVILGLVKRLQETTRPDLNLIVMSATLDVAPIAAFLKGRDGGKATRVLEADGRTFPVEIRYAARQDPRRVSERAAEQIVEIGRSTSEGDILVFMPGMGDINATMRQLSDRRLGQEFEVMPLHGELPVEQQDRVFKATQRRKVIIATNVAESSITIQGVLFVVDSGLARVARFDAETGLNSLEIEEISQASADQRSGRAGRTAPGICYRLWTESGQLNRLPQTTPEVQRTELSEIVLQLHALGIRRAESFDWLDAPNVLAVRQAEDLLSLLGAFSKDTNGEEHLSDIGRRMLRLPMLPRYARMLIEGARRGCFAEAALCAALVSGRGLMIRGARGDQQIQQAQETFQEDERSDFFTLMRAYETVRVGGFRLAECRHFGVSRQVAMGVEQVYQQLAGLGERLGGEKGRVDKPPEQKHEAVLKCLLAGFVDQICQRRSQGTLECLIVGGRKGTLARESVVQDSPFFVATDIRTISSNQRGSLTLISQASHFEAAWLDEVYPGAIERRAEHLYDRTQKRVEVVEIERFGDLVLTEEKSKEFDPKASGVSLAKAWREEWLTLPLFDHRVQQLLLRIALLTAHQPELKVVPIDDDLIEKIIGRALKGERLGKEAQKKPLLPYFKEHLSKEAREWLAELYPDSFVWIDGKARKIVYHVPKKKSGGENVEALLNVTITECFKLDEHPTLGDGAVPITLIMSVPKGKELARTTDWPGFKIREYPSLKSRWKLKHPTVTWL